MKKYIYFISIFIVLFVIYLFIYFLPRNYEIVYNVDNFKVKEFYNKNNKYYYFEISNKKYTFEKSFYSKYYSKRKRIDDISVIKEDDLYCIIPTIKKNRNFPICYKNEELTSIYLIDNEKVNKYKETMEDDTNTFNKININNYYNSTIAVWNYKGLYFLKKDDNMNIKLFLEDIFIDELTVLVDNILFIPDYNSKHTFSSVYLLDMKTGNVETIDFEHSISYDSYILGHKENKLYLLDKKNKKEYEINLKKKKIKLIGTEEKLGLIYNGKWESVSIKKLINDKITFVNDNIYNYQIIDEKLFLSYKNGKQKVLISDTKGIEILSVQKDTIIYQVEDSIYAYNPLYGNKKMMTYFEWNFNKYNKVFIYNQF